MIWPGGLRVICSNWTAHSRMVGVALEAAEQLAAEGIEAEVVEVIYMGDLFRTVLKVAGHDDFVIKSRNTLGQRVLTPGEKIRIGWAPQDARALDPV